jgi:shikimate dehydrogenase
VSDLYALFGTPIRHSLSPKIHASFARATGQTLRYVAIECDAASFASEWQAFVAAGGRGGNLTIPLKVHALDVVDELGASARTAGAVNTLITLNDGRVRGENTDGIGFIRDLTERHQLRAPHAKILLLGAGGAARGVLPTLFAVAVGDDDRHRERAHALIEDFRALDVNQVLRAVDLSDAATLDGFDLVINTTPTEAFSPLRMNPRWFTPASMAYDLNYGGRARAFLEFAEHAGASRTHDGLGMLLEQAAEAFYFWRGVRPDTQPLYRELSAR